MSGNLRDIVTGHQEEQVLRQYLQNNYDSTPAAEKARFISAVRDTIDREVNSILAAFVEEAQIGSPEKKRRRNRNILNLLATLVSTPAIGYAVNIENWVMVGLFSALLLVVQIYIIASE
ncbi:hypothetical protein MUB16_34825 [Priestia sp. OVL9]|nr:hypothetical protein [Priestia sp. OVL9]MCJ7987795.1 hypothetical protein [Priestia sp. OVL9]MCJ7987832.1 hypothetical protein [Priestia sp. OVL9]